MSRRHSRKSASIAVVLTGIFASGSVAHAKDDDPSVALKLSGFVNIAAAVADARDETNEVAALEGELEFSPQYRLPSGTVLAGRIAVGYRQSAIASGGSSSLAIPEISLFAIGDFGRIEIGNRAGFPQSLIGFTPSEIAFTQSEYDPESGASLDPDGRLPTTFAPPELASQIDRLTYLGYAARFYDDRSAKIIYLSPRFRSGLYGALSFTPRTNRPGGYQIAGSSQPGTSSYRNVIQAALVWNHRTQNVDLSIGGTWSHATATAGAPLITGGGSTDSVSGGLTATVKDRFVFGISGTIESRRIDPAGSRADRQPFGIVTSFNYVDGPWIAGGYYQHAVAPSARTPNAHDKLDVAQIGLSYLIDKNHDLLGEGFYTDIKLFVTGTNYRLEQIGASAPSEVSRLTVVLIGARFSFF